MTRRVTRDASGTRGGVRGLSRDALIYTSGDVASRALGFISVPVYTHVFAPAEYSLLAFVSTLATLASGVAILGGDTVLTRMWFEVETTAARRRLVTTWVGFLALSAVVLCAALALLAPTFASSLLEDPSGLQLLLLVLATVPLTNTSRMLAQILRNEFRPVAYAATSFAISAIALSTGLVLVLRLDLGIAGILIGILAGEAVVLLIRAAVTRPLLFGGFDAELLRRLLRFGVPLVPVTMSFWVFTASDRVILAKVGGFEDLGYYSVSLSLVSLFAIFSAAVGQAWVPRLTQLYERDRARAAEVVGASITYYLFALGLAALVMSAIAPELIALLTAPAYAPAATVVPMLALGAVAYGSSMLTSSGLTLTYRTGRLSTLSIGAAVVNVVLALALVPGLGMRGAALASLLGYTALTVVYLAASQRVWRVTLDRRRLLATVTALVLAMTGTSLLLSAPLILRLALVPAYVALTALLAGINGRDRQILSELIGRSLGRPRRGRPAGN